MTNPTLILSIFSFFLFIYMICQYFETKALKKHIKCISDSNKNLCDKLAESERRQKYNLDKINLLQWQIANPPKYKKGDKIGDLIINSHEVYNPGLGDYLIKGAHMFFEYLFERKISKDHDRIFTRQYVYHLTHVVSGEKVTKRELELIELSKSTN